MDFVTDNTKWAAFLRRDPQANGLFFAGVRTTGVYCSSICGGRPSRKNVTFFADADAAKAAGLRPCRLCKPDG